MLKFETKEKQLQVHLPIQIKSQQARKSMTAFCSMLQLRNLKISWRVCVQRTLPRVMNGQSATLKPGVTQKISNFLKYPDNLFGDKKVACQWLL